MNMWCHLILGFVCMLFSTNAYVANQAQTIEDSEESLGTNIPSSKRIFYTVGTQRVTWFQAFALCKQSNAELASITSSDEEAALETYLNTLENKEGYGEGYWLAATKHATFNNDFVWFNSGKPVIYRKFAPGEPDNYANNEPCLQIFLRNKQFVWNDNDCFRQLKFICQYDR